MDQKVIDKTILDMLKSKHIQIGILFDYLFLSTLEVEIFDKVIFQMKGKIRKLENIVEEHLLVI